MQVLQNVYDEADNRLRVDAQLTAVIPGPLEVAIDQATDSIRLGDGTNLITATIIGGKTGLDVNIVGGTITLPPGLATEATLSGLSAKFNSLGPVSSTVNGELQTSDISNNGGVNGAITVGTSAVEAKVGGSVLSNRKQLIIFHNGSGKLYCGMSPSVTSANGIPIFKNTMLTIPAGSNSHIWLIADTSGNDIRLAELA